jgi:uncharacterized membrane protein
MQVLGVPLIVLGVMFMVFNRWYARQLLRTIDQVRARDVPWLRGSAVVSGIFIALTGLTFIWRGD